MSIRLFTILMVTLCFSSCSVFMAASSQEEKDVEAIHIGMHRSDAEVILGKPISVIRDSRGDIATYIYISHDEKNYERAATYALLDGLTLGLAELVTFPVEALQGRKNEVVIIFNRKHRVKEITHLQHEPVVPKPEDALGLSKKSRGAI